MLLMRALLMLYEFICAKLCIITFVNGMKCVSYKVETTYGSAVAQGTLTVLSVP